MTGWNMPPGCNVIDIPGNSPENEAAEAFADAFFERATSSGLSQEQAEELAPLFEWVWREMGNAYRAGYQAGAADELLRGSVQKIGEKAHGDQ